MKNSLRLIFVMLLIAVPAFAQLQLTMHGQVTLADNAFSDIPLGTEVWTTIQTDPAVAFPVLSPPNGVRLPAIESIWTSDRSLVTDLPADIYVSRNLNTYGIESIGIDYSGGPSPVIFLWSSSPNVISGNFLSSGVQPSNFYLHYGDLGLPQSEISPNSTLQWNIDSITIAPLAQAQPVPEPSTYGLTAVALLAFFAIKRVKRRGC